MKKRIMALVLALIGSSLNVFADDSISESAPNAKVYFIQPVDGQTVQQKFKVVFGLSNMGVAPAGVSIKDTGHHHLLIDSDILPDLTKQLPVTDKIKHFGGGQTETELALPPGKHTLQLILGNSVHIPHTPPVISEKITITVQ